MVSEKQKIKKDLEKFDNKVSFYRKIFTIFWYTLLGVIGLLIIVLYLLVSQYRGEEEDLKFQYKKVIKMEGCGHKSDSILKRHEQFFDLAPTKWFMWGRTKIQMRKDIKRRKYEQSKCSNKHNRRR